MSANYGSNIDTNKKPQSNWRHRKPKSRKDIEHNCKSSNIPTLLPNTDSKTEDNNEIEHCFICTEPISCYSVGVCNHRTCHLCSLRLRALYKNKACGYCKTELKYVVFTRDREKPFEQFNLRELPARDENTSVYFDTQELCDETFIILRFNCPDRKCSFQAESGWEELEEHVKTVHQRSLCNICIKHKKVFSHEHTVFTRAQLQKHMSIGDSKDPNNTTGFKGHPKCEFCNISFYDGDQLFEHCRDKHEQCHICVRNRTGRNDYYVNYSTLEQHFLEDHFLCTYQECLNKKFVVFQSDIDLKAHLIEEHRGVANQRAQLRQTRQIEVNFSYSNSSRSHGHDRNRRDNRQNRKDNEIDSRDKGPKKSKQKGRFNPPPEFGSTLTESASSSSSGDMQETKEPTKVKDSNLTAFDQSSRISGLLQPSASIDKQTLSKHASFMERLSGYLDRNKERITNFKQLTASYRTNQISVSRYLESIQRLVPTSKDPLSITGKIVNGVADLLDIKEKRQELLLTWNDCKIQENQDFPILESTRISNDSVSNNAARRVLVIKSQGGLQSGSGQRDRVTVTAKKSTLSNRSALRPSVSTALRPSALSKTSTPWSGSAITHLVSPTPPKEKNPTDDFPSLPRVPKPPKIPGLPNRGGKVESVWGKPKDTSSAGVEDVSLSNDKKKKGKQILFYYG